MPIDRVLVVEDSMIIALDTEETLLQLGIGQVAVAGTVAGALDCIAKGPPEFALLDYNLGDESSEAVAAELSRHGIPFYFVTGYGDAVGKLTESKAAGVLQKPFSPSDLAQVLQQVDGTPRTL